MAFDHHHWIRIFKQSPGYNDAAHLGVQTVNHFGARWRVLGVHHLTGDENRGNHHLYCDVLDEFGSRISGTRLEMIQGNQAPVYAVVDKPPNEPGTNFPIWGAAACEVRVFYPADDPLLSDEVTGVRINHVSDGPGNSLGHNSFFVCFKKASDDRPPDPPEPGPEPEPPPVRVGKIQVTVNVDWVNSLRKDAQGNVTFYVDVDK